MTGAELVIGGGITVARDLAGLNWMAEVSFSGIRVMASGIFHRYITMEDSANLIFFCEINWINWQTVLWAPADIKGVF